MLNNGKMSKRKMRKVYKSDAKMQPILKVNNDE